MWGNLWIIWIKIGLRNVDNIEHLGLGLGIELGLGLGLGLGWNWQNWLVFCFVAIDDDPRFNLAETYTRLGTCAPASNKRFGEC